MSHKISFPGWEKLSQEDRFLIQDCLDSFLAFVSNYSKLNGSFQDKRLNSKIRELKKDDLEQLILNSEQPVRFEIVDVSDSTGVTFTINEVLQSSKKILPERNIDDLICSLTCKFMPDSSACRECSNKSE